MSDRNRILVVSMPEMDGYEVIEAMKADRKLASIPIVVETDSDHRFYVLRAVL